jgi:hypothetical protein
MHLGQVLYSYAPICLTPYFISEVSEQCLVTSEFGVYIKSCKNFIDFLKET